MAPQSLEALSGLLRYSSLDDHEERLAAADVALKHRPGDVLAQKTKVVALLSLDRFAEALDVIASGSSMPEELSLEKAYALYKTGQLDAAADTLRTTSSTGRAFEHLAAQVAYRAEKFENTVGIYPKLLSEDDGGGGEENDIKINLLAGVSQLEWQGKGYFVDGKWKQPTREDLDVFETAYNAACACLARWDFARAAILLKRARSLCETSEELGEEERKTEVLPIILQQICHSIYTGKEAEADAWKQTLEATSNMDHPIGALLKANTALLGIEERNPFLTQRTIASLNDIDQDASLFAYQRQRLALNKGVADLRAQKFSARNLSLAQNQFSLAGKTSQFNAINAARLIKLETAKPAVRSLQLHFAEDPTNVGLLLTLVQLVVQGGNPGHAVVALETFFRGLEQSDEPEKLDIRYAPGLVALAVTLFRGQGWQTRVRVELAKAAEYWQSKNPDSSAYSLLCDAGVDLLKSPRTADLKAASETFERLCAAKPGDQLAAAGLVASIATTDYEKIAPYLGKLAPLDKLVSGVDVDVLVNTGVANLATQATTAAKKRSATEPQQLTTQPKPKRKRKLPKDYEEGKNMDPERWLPLRDRSTYRPKGRKARKRAQDATQGGVVREVETLELVGGAGAVRVEKAPVGGSAAKKKKKGKK